MDIVPVDVFLCEETIVLVHEMPQSLEVAARIVVVFFFVDARREGDNPE